MLIGIDASRAATRERTGTENYSLNLIRHLLALESGHRYRLYFNRPPTVELFPMTADLELRPTRRFDVGLGTRGQAGTTKVEGGMLGIIIDARGRPLPIAQDPAEQREKIQRWLWDMGS